MGMGAKANGNIGLGPALWVCRALHALSVVAMVVLGVMLGLGPAYWVGVAAVAALLWYENSLVKADDLSRVDAAFFSVSGSEFVESLVGVGAAFGPDGDRADLGPGFGEDLTEAEVRYLMKVEWARFPDDILWRRSKLGLTMPPADREALAAFMANAM